MADAVFEPEVKRSLRWLQKDLRGNMPPLAIECKKTMEARLSFDKVQDEQIEGLLKFSAEGYVRKLIVSQGFGKGRRFTGGTPFDFFACGAGYGYLLVNFRFTTKSPKKGIPKGTNVCFAVPAETYKQAKADAQAAGQASLPFVWFAENAIECPRMRRKNDKGAGEGGWDLSALVTQ